MSQSIDDIDEDLNRFCEDMESELRALSEPIESLEEKQKQSLQQDNVRSEDDENEKNKKKKETTVTSSPWGISLFSSFASSASKSISSSFSPFAKDISSISSLATSATKAFSDTINSTVYSDPNQNENDLTALAQTPETLAKLQRIQAEHDAKRSEMEYACLLASKTAREIVVLARSITEIPFTVPPGKEISWKFHVKHYDILFGVKLRVQEDDGSGEWSEHELLPLGRITSEDHVDESCYAETCARKFIFTLDNSIAMLYSKTVAFDIVMTDDLEWEKRQVEVQDNFDFETKHDTINEQVTTPASCTETENVFDSCVEGIHFDTYDELSLAKESCISTDELNDSIEDWTMYYNEDGQPYYYNNYTNESQWEIPQNFVLDNGADNQQHIQNEAVEDDTDMATLMLKISQGYKAGQISPEQRQKFMADIIDCRELTEIHKDLNEIFDKADSPQSKTTTV